jgi:signal-transduction protein with cAMP-binding, CBS, and nucleotidyltransferase domain
MAAWAGEAIVAPEKGKRTMQVGDVGEIGALATRPAVTCLEAAPVAQVARQMQQHDVGCVVIVDDDDQVSGIVTEHDLITRVLARDLGPDCPVHRVMTREVVTIREDGDLADAAGQMAVRECRRLPVVNHEGRVVAVVGFDDVFERASEIIEELALAVRHRRHPSTVRSAS